MRTFRFGPVSQEVLHGGAAAGITACLALLLLMVALTPGSAAITANAQGPGPQIFLPLVSNAPSGQAPLGAYVLLGWNDLGMHCYNGDFTDLAVLPPYNTLWAQVIKRGNPPRIITQGIQVSYSYPANTKSSNKSNFWTYAQKIFGLPAPLTPDIGLTGRGLSGRMDPAAPAGAAPDHFIAEGIPLTEFTDAAPTTRDPYQLAELVAKDASTGTELARLPVVSPVSTEMHCDNCHSDNGDGNEGIATGRVTANILTTHDNEEQRKYPTGHTGSLMSRRPILCAECHSSNALGAPGAGNIPSLSNAIHRQHTGIVPDTKDGCYNCHPGPTTQCLRDVMSSQKGMDCISCHGGMAQVAQNTNPWLQEPRCDNAACHGSKVQQTQALYRFSTGMGGVYCEACHDSTHAIAPSTQTKDGMKFMQLQGHAGPLDSCTVCHLTQPTTRMTVH